MEVAEIPTVGKTKKWEIRGRRGGLLGIVAWYGPWRQYTFLPEANTVFNGACLADIAGFLAGEMRKRRKVTPK